MRMPASIIFLMSSLFWQLHYVCQCQNLQIESKMKWTKKEIQSIASPHSRYARSIARFRFLLPFTCNVIKFSQFYKNCEWYCAVLCMLCCDLCWLWNVLCVLYGLARRDVILVKCPKWRQMQIRRVSTLSSGYSYFTHS